MDIFTSNKNKLFIFEKIIYITKLNLNDDKKNKLFTLINSTIKKYSIYTNKNINELNNVTINDILKFLKNNNNNNNNVNNINYNNYNKNIDTNNNTRKSLQINDIDKYRMERNMLFENKKIQDIDFTDKNYKPKKQVDTSITENINIFSNDFSGNEIKGHFSNIDEIDTNLDQINIDPSYYENTSVEERLNKLKNNRNENYKPLDNNFPESIDPKNDNKNLSNNNLSNNNNNNNNTNNNKIDETNISKALVLLADKINILEQKIELIQK